MEIKNKKRNKKKSFFFKDYTEAEITSDQTVSFIKISINRISFLFFIFFSLLLIFSVKIIYLSLLSDKVLTSENINRAFIKERHDIVDKNGTIITRSIDIYDAGIRPNLIKDKKKF